MIPIYVINLPHRTDRLQRISKQLNGYNMAFRVFPATHCEDGAYGLKMTMCRLFSEVKDDVVLVLEDDCDFVRAPILLETIFKQLPKGYDLLFLGGNVYKPAKRFSSNLNRLSACVANHAVVYTRKVMDIMAQVYAESDGQTDVLLDRHIVSKGNSFITNPLLATQYAGYSDIEQKETDYHNLLIDRYRKNVS